MSQKISIALAGNPNCGKTTLFNALTGSHQSVGNWPGVTVEKKSGSFTLNDQQITLVDLPGVYSLQPCEASCEDERVAREYILSGESSLVVNIVDASNLERNLYLTAQLIEMQVPLIVAVNMLDVAKNHSISVDLDKLAQELDCPVVGLVASRETGVDVLKQAISRQLENPTVPHNPLVFPKDIADEIHTLTRELSENNVEKAPWIAEQILEGDKELGLRTLKSDFTKAELRINALNKHYNGDLDMAIADVRYSFVSKVASSCITRDNEVKQTITDKIDRIVLHRWLGVPIFLAVMYLMFIFSINVGSAFIDFFDILFGAIFIDGFGELLTSIGTPEWLKTILADGIGGDIHSGHLLFVLSLIFPGRLRIYGQSRLCDGPSDESARAARKSLCSSDCRIRLRRARYHGNAHYGTKTRPHYHGFNGSVHELRRKIAGLRFVCDCLLADERTKSRFRFVSHRHLGSYRHRLHAQEDGLSRSDKRLCHGDSSVPSADRKEHPFENMGSSKELYFPRR